MLRPSRRTALVASAAVLASLYAVLGLVPISALIGVSGFITLREAASPLVGMLLGPVFGGASIFLGVLVDFGLGRPVVFLGLDFLIDAAAAATAGLAFYGKRWAAVGLPAALIVVFELNPTAPAFVEVGGLWVPFVWMHVASVGLLAAVLWLEKRGRVTRLSPPFVAGVVLASTMAGHITGGILTETFYLDSGVLFGFASASAYWSFIFFLYPVERVFLTIVGTAIAVPVLRAVDSRMKRVRAS